MEVWVKMPDGAIAITVVKALVSGIIHGLANVV